MQSNLTFGGSSHASLNITTSGWNQLFTVHDKQIGTSGILFGDVAGNGGDQALLSIIS